MGRKRNNELSEKTEHHQAAHRDIRHQGGSGRSRSAESLTEQDDPEHTEDGIGGVGERFGRS